MILRHLVAGARCESRVKSYNRSYIVAPTAWEGVQNGPSRPLVVASAALLLRATPGATRATSASSASAVAAALELRGQEAQCAARLPIFAPRCQLLRQQRPASSMAGRLRFSFPACAMSVQVYPS